MKRLAVYSMIGMLQLVGFLVGCGQTLPPEKFVFDGKFDSLYRAVTSKDTMFFENSKNATDTFVLTNVDSVVSDRIDCFMCPRAAKTVFRNYKQVPVNYWADRTVKNQGSAQEQEVKSEASLIAVTKYADVDLTTAHISFKNFQCKLTGSLGKFSKDTLRLNERVFTNYYVIDSIPESFVVNDDDVRLLFVTLKDGIVAYKEKSGIIRKRLR